MTSAVLDRVLAIPDYDLDRPQMGLSTHNRSVLRARGYKRTDGTEAKDRFIKADKKLQVKEAAKIKGDKPLTPELAAKVKGAIANLKPQEAKGKKAVPTKEQILSSFKSNVPLAKGNLNDSNFAYSDNNSYVIKVAKGRKNSEAYEVYSQGVTGATRKAPIDANMQGALSKVADAVTKINQSPDIVTASRRSRKVIKGKSPRDRQPQATNTKIAPDTAKKIKGAIAGVKGGKVVKGVSPRDRGASRIPITADSILYYKKGKDNFMTGDESHIVKMGDQLPDAVFSRLKDITKRLGGSYNSQGHDRGFVFKDKQTAHSFIRKELARTETDKNKRPSEFKSYGSKPTLKGNPINKPTLRF